MFPGESLGHIGLNLSPALSLASPNITVFPSCVQREHMLSCYWGQPGLVALRHDPSRPYAEQYRIDAQQFTRLFLLLSPWTCGAHTEILAERTFRLLDDNMDQLLEFRAFASCLGTTVAPNYSGWGWGALSQA